MLLFIYLIINLLWYSLNKNSDCNAKINLKSWLIGPDKAENYSPSYR